MEGEFVGDSAVPRSSSAGSTLSSTYSSITETTATSSTSTKGIHQNGSSGQSSQLIGLEKKGLGVAASVLGTMLQDSPPEQSQKQTKEEFLDLPHSVLQMVATALQCDVIVAGLLHSPHGLLETVLCVPRDLINVPVRLSKGLLSKSNCEVRQPRPPQAASQIVTD